MRTDRISFIEPGTDGKNVTICQSNNYGYSANSQELLVPMDNVHLEGTEGQSIISTSG